MRINKNNIGATSLSFAVLGMLFFYTLTIYRTENILFQMCLAGFEAAVVGGVADWFAVTALFKEIPIPVLKKHTNIIVKSRGKLTKGIVSLVAEQWLSKESILFRVNKLLSVSLISKQLQSKSNHQLILNSFNTALCYSLQNTDIKKIEYFLKYELLNLLKSTRVNNYICDVGLSLLRQNKQEKPIQFLLTKLEFSLQREVVLLELEKTVRKQIEQYTSNKSSFTKLFVEVTQTVGGLDAKMLAIKIQDSLCTFVRDLATNKKHPIRLEIDRELFALVDTKVGRNKIKNILDTHVPSLIEKYLNDSIISSLLNTALKTIRDNDSGLNKKLKLILEDKTNSIAKNKEQVQKIRCFIINSLINVISKNHHLVASTVNENLNKLTNEGLINQIEDKVGKELQYIRLNGAIIGGLVGCLLFMLKHVLH